MGGVYLVLVEESKFLVFNESRSEAPRGTIASERREGRS